MTVLFISRIHLAVAVVSGICTTEFRFPAVTVNALDWKEKMNDILDFKFSQCSVCCVFSFG
jgi:uncharacterized membrane protein YpjA